MTAWRSLLFVAILMTVAGISCLLWEQRGFRTSPAANAAFTNTIVVSDLYPGGKPPATLPNPDAHTHEELSGYDVGEGKRLYHWFNCVGCHSEGGGAIGPALMDDKWIYGSDPQNIYATILEGRPNGMPSFRGKIPDAQVWQIVAYVRSMSGNVPLYAKPSRNDDLTAKKPESMTPGQPAHLRGAPAANQGSLKK